MDVSDRVPGRVSTAPKPEPRPEFPDPAPVARPHRRAQPSSRHLAIVLACTYLVISTVLGTVLLVTTGQARRATPVPVNRSGPALPGIGMTDSTAPAGHAPPGFQAVTGTGGLTTVVPDSWRVEACQGNPTCQQADDPAGRSSFLRFGGSPSPAGSLTTVQAEFARQFKVARDGYREIRFTPTHHHGHAAVDWEFEWDNEGVRRHARALNWRVNGTDYSIYASAELAGWPALEPVFAAMVAHSAP